MKVVFGKDTIKIVPESQIDRAYLEVVFGFNKGHRQDLEVDYDVGDNEIDSIVISHHINCAKCIKEVNSD